MLEHDEVLSGVTGPGPSSWRSLYIHVDSERSMLLWLHRAEECDGSGDRVNTISS